MTINIELLLSLETGSREVKLRMVQVKLKKDVAFEYLSPRNASPNE